VYLLGVAVVVSGLWSLTEDQDDDWGRRRAVRFVLAIGLIAGGNLLSLELGGRAELRIARTLPVRVSRPGRLPLRTMFGRLRGVVLIIALAVEVALTAVLIEVGPGWLARVYGAGLGFAVAFVGLGIFRATIRPTIAVDDVSLAIDERLRSEDAFTPTAMLYLLLIAIPASGLLGTLPGWLVGLWIASTLLIQLLFTWAQAKPPWRRAVPRISDWA
jgi:hypothetical protein